MTGTARTAILRQIRAARAAGAAPVTVPRGYDGPGAHPGSDLPGLLADRLVDYGALIRRSPAGAAPAAIAAALRERGARRVAIPDGLPVEWIAALPEPWPDRPRLEPAELAALDATLTTVTVAIAQTGTLVLDHGPGQGRRELSLVPDMLVAMVPRSRIVGSVPDAVAALDPMSPLTWISGPSATSDIELTRVQGVHGPRTLAVIILA